MLPNRREALILQVLVARDRYGLEIRNELARAEQKRMPLGSLYTSLERMIDKGLLRSRLGESAHVRGGNRRRYFAITAKGRRALDAYQLPFNRAQTAEAQR
jgi:DNA-binding PadR family transcriptional regulator